MRTMGVTVDEHESTDTLATRVRGGRETAKLTQAQVAAEVGVSRPTLLAMEKGNRAISPSELVKLADLYGRDVANLLRPSPPPASIRAKFRTGLITGPNDGDLE